MENKLYYIRGNKQEKQVGGSRNVWLGETSMLYLVKLKHMNTEKRLEFATEFRDRYKNDRDNLIKECKNKKVDIDFLADSFGCWGDDNWKPMIEKASKTYSTAVDKELKKYFKEN